MNLFVYGTLMDRDVMTMLCGVNFLSQPATLIDHQRKLVKGEVFPAIVHKSASKVEGLVYFDLSAQDLECIDHFEGHLYQRSEERVVYDVNKLCSVYVYKLLDQYRHMLSDKDWSFDLFVKQHKAKFLGREF